LVENFAHLVGLDCVSLLGSQLAPEDLIGVPQIKDGVSQFCPPKIIARDEPYGLFLDELNACTHEVQKAFYSLINDRRIGEYHLPIGSIVIGAGNRAQDNAIVKPMSSALMNRMVHVHLKASHRDWLTWAYDNDIHHWILAYIQVRPDHLWSQPPKHEAPFSTPRSWHMLSDALHQFGDEVSDDWLEVLASGLLSPNHAQQFRAFVRQTRSEYRIEDILKGKVKWPSEPDERDILYFLAQSFRAHLVRNLPENQRKATRAQKDLAFTAKAQLKQLARISLEMAQMVVSGESDTEAKIADWFMVEIVRDLPRLVREA
ncbi:MAG: AAA family ATPase, partial [Chloroflexota bacterium]